MKINFFRFSVIFMLLAVTGSAVAAIDKTTSSTLEPLKIPTIAQAEEALLDIGITPLNDGLHLTDDDDTVFPEVRYAEAIYFSNQLAKTMEKSGAWGAIRVIPSTDVIMDVYITGTVLQSDGEMLDLDMQVYDTSGKKWFTKRYKQKTMLRSSLQLSTAKALKLLQD